MTSDRFLRSRLCASPPPKGDATDAAESKRFRFASTARTRHADADMAACKEHKEAVTGPEEWVVGRLGLR